MLLRYFREIAIVFLLTALIVVSTAYVKELKKNEEYRENVARMERYLSESRNDWCQDVLVAIGKMHNELCKAMVDGECR